MIKLIKSITLTIFILLLTLSFNVILPVTALANQAPEFDPIGYQSVNEGMLLQFTINAVDPDGDPLTYTAGNLPDGATFNPTARIFNWTPSYSQAGTYAIQFQVNDGQFTIDETVNITVVNVNRQPLFSDPSNYSGTVGKLLSFTLKSNNSNSKDGLTYSAFNLPPGAAFDSATGVFNWTPATAGIYPVQFTVNDGHDNLSSIIIIKVDDGSDPPAIHTVTTYLAQCDKPLAFTVTAVDPDGDPLTYFASNLPSGATFNPATKTFTWTPSHGQIGEYTAHFTVSDGILSDSKDIKIIVDNINQPPVFDAVSARNVTSGSLLQFSVNAVDPDGDTLTYTAVNLPDGASFNPTDKTFSWTPDDSQTGSYQIKFTASDGILTTSMDVAITVTNPVVYGGKIIINTNPNTENDSNSDPEINPAGPRNFNRQPVFNLINPQNVNEEEFLQFTISAVDPDGDNLTYTASNLPKGASFDSTTKTFAWTPELEQAGSYRVNFTVSDGELTDSQEVLIDVNMVEEEIGLQYFGARFYDPKCGRFLTQDPIKDGANWFAYCGNNPLNRIDPNGQDYVMLNMVWAGLALGYGHNACLVGNDEDGWVYYSKDGAKAGNAREEYKTFKEFQTKDTAKKYDRAYRVKTTREQDEKMKDYGDKNYDKPYSIKETKNGETTESENCADLTAGIAKAGGLNVTKPKSAFIITIPNTQYYYFTICNEGESVPPSVDSSNGNESDGN